MKKSWKIGLLGVGIAAAATAAAVVAAVDPAVVKQFREECGTKAAAADKAGVFTVVGKDGWLFFAPELRHLSVGQYWGPDAAKVSRAENPDRADPLPAILDFKAQLQKAGIGLVMVPVPAKAAVYPDELFNNITAGAGQLPRLDVEDAAFEDVLRQNGVQVLDLWATLVAHRSDADGPVYCKTDTHWSGRACVLAAQQLAALVGNQPWYKALPRTKYATEWKTVQIDGDLRDGLGAAAPPKESIPLRVVGTKNGAEIQPVAPNPDSPVVLLGDSHNLVFSAGGDMHAVGAGLPDQLAAELGFPVDLVGVRGSGATPARVNMMRTVRAHPDYLPKKKLVIWCFTTREFTESTGWSKVPIVK